MKIRYERPVCRSAFWSYRLGLFAFALFAISAGLHRFSIMETEIFTVLFSICVGIALLAFGLACYGILRLWMVGAEGGRASAKGSLCALLVLVPAGIAGYRAYSLPPLYDISTDTADVPVFLETVSHGPDWVPDVEFLRSAPYEGQLGAYPQVTGRRYEGALDRVLAAVRLVAENRGIAISATKLPDPPEPETPETNSETSIIEIEPQTPGDVAATSEPADGDAATPAEPMILKQVQILLQGETRSPVFGFASDVSIRLSEEAETTFVDMRSVSRFGPHDLGTNARIIDGFLSALDAELVGISVR
ncbi:MAG: DUF1499 domain-containing protein [Hyphomicrobiales bacterium]|nr:DUF1499 domain-containing protein [Hyphomicrobiales bacterium]MCP5000518.1 DUF1499 domain-containing protein [Hyphomicrobiales bacterium]